MRSTRALADDRSLAIELRRRAPRRAASRVVAAIAAALAACQSGPPMPPLVETATRGDLTLRVHAASERGLPPMAPTLKELFFTCYPSLLERFENPAKPASRVVTLVYLPELNYPAATSGSTIRISIPLTSGRPDDVGFLTHELAHVAQSYPIGCPGWLVEGIADYAREEYGPAPEPSWKLPESFTAKQSYRDGYTTTARFLVWVDERRPGFVDELHAAMQRGAYTDATFEELAGKGVEVLWRECVEDLASRTAARSSDRIPFIRADGLVFVEVQPREGPPILALLDTGANASAIDPGRSSELPVVGTGAVVGTTGSFEAENVELSGLRLGARELPVLRATRRDLGGLLAPEGREVEMILGSDALAGLAVTIDFTAGVIELLAGSHGDAGAGVPMVLDDGIPAIPASLGGVDLVLRIDTGASLFATEDVYVNVPAPVWDALQARDPALKPTRELRGTGASGEPVPLPVAQVRGARIGPKELESVFVIVQPVAGYFADPQAKGFVGNNFLEKLGRVTFDYASGRFASGAPGEGRRP